MFNYTLDGNRDLMNSSRISEHVEVLSNLNKLTNISRICMYTILRPRLLISDRVFHGVICNYRALKQRDVTIQLTADESEDKWYSDNIL